MSYKSLALPSVPLIPALLALAGVMMVAYIGLIAFIMAYGSLETQMAQQVRDTHAAIGSLEATYLAQVAQINDSDPAALGYQKPAQIAFVDAAPRTAVSLKTR